MLNFQQISRFVSFQIYRSQNNKLYKVHLILNLIHTPNI